VFAAFSAVVIPYAAFVERRERRLRIAAAFAERARAEVSGSNLPAPSEFPEGLGS
jgi:hypothetical protein